MVPYLVIAVKSKLQRVHDKDFWWYVTRPCCIPDLDGGVAILLCESTVGSIEKDAPSQKGAERHNGNSLIMQAKEKKRIPRSHNHAP